MKQKVILGLCIGSLLIGGIAFFSATEKCGQNSALESSPFLISASATEIASDVKIEWNKRFGELDRNEGRSVFCIFPNTAIAETDCHLECSRYLGWCFRTIGIIDDYNELISNSMNNSHWENWNYELMREHANSKYNYIDSALNDINNFNLPSNMNKSMNEFKLYLEDNKLSAYYVIEAVDGCESGSYSIFIENLVKGLNYFESAKQHGDNSLVELRKFKEPCGCPPIIPTPTKPPGFEVIFAIVGLLAVAYLLRRRLE